MKLKLFMSLFIFCFSSSPVFAQEFDFQRSWADYIYTTGQYQQVHEQYSKAKQTYNTYQTLTTRNDAVAAAAAVLKSREELVRTYLVMFRMKLYESKLSLDSNKQEKINSADILVSWLEGRKSKLDAIGNIDDLNEISAEFENKYPEITSLSFGMIASYKVGEIGLVIERIDNLKDEIKKKKDDFSEKDKIEFDRSIVQIEEKISLAKSKRQQALSELENLSDKRTKDYLAIWRTSRSALVDCQQYLREVLVFMDEITGKNE